MNTNTRHESINQIYNNETSQLSDSAYPDNYNVNEAINTSNNYSNNNSIASIAIPITHTKP